MSFHPVVEGDGGAIGQMLYSYLYYPLYLRNCGTSLTR